MDSFERVRKEIFRIYWAISNLFFCLLSDLFFLLILIQLLRQVKIVFPCSGICCLCFALCQIIGFRHYFGDPYSFSKRQQHTFCFLFFLWKRKKSYERLIPLWYTLDRNSLKISTNLIFSFQTCSNLNLSIYLYLYI